MSGVKDGKKSKHFVILNEIGMQLMKIRPVARKDYRSIAHEASRMGY